MTLIGTPPVVKKQKLLDQNVSFQINCLTLGKSGFIKRALAPLYTLMNFVNSVLGWTLNRIGICSLS